MRLVSGAVEHSPDCVFFVDPETLRFEYVNRAAVQLYGYSHGELKTMTPAGLSAERTEKDIHPLIAPLLLGEKTSLRFETNHRHKVGFEIPVEVSLQAATLSGKQQRVVAIARDISARKAAEQALLTAKEDADRASRSKSELLANLSHELRTPLAGVIGMLELLNDTELMGHQRHLIEVCRSSGEHLLQLTNNVLDFSKVEADKLDLDAVEFDLTELIATTVEATAWGAGARRLSVRHQIDESSNLTLRGDKNRLRQVLVNLVGNAVKFTTDGEVTVRASVVTRERDTATIRFDVSDTGIGIPADKIGRLFQPYSQADASISRSFGGTGLGLAISRSLVELMGGTIGVESRPGVGSTFWFEVPFEEVVDGAPGSPLALPSRQTDMGVQSPGHRKATGLAGHVLLAEDDAVNRLYLVEVLKRLGLIVDVAANGRDAVAAVQRDRYDIVLMDCQMPELDGFGATRCIRDLEVEGMLIGRMPIVALTASAMEGDRQRCLDAGMDDYLSKPVEARQVADVVQRWLTDCSLNSQLSHQ